jgi:hypothetical protein
MTFHLPSFLLGVVTGAAGATLWDRLRPIAAELSGAGYELGESLWRRLATLQEDAEDLLAEGRARATRRTPTRHARRAHRRPQAGTR